MILKQIRKISINELNVNGANDKSSSHIGPKKSSNTNALYILEKKAVKQISTPALADCFQSGETDENHHNLVSDIEIYLSEGTASCFCGGGGGYTRKRWSFKYVDFRS